MSLDELRQEIDKTDSEIVRLISRRLRIAEEIGLEKQEQGKQIEDRAREQAVLENVKRLARKEKISPEVIENVYREVVAASRARQGITVAFQGELGAYGEEAAISFFGPSVKVMPCESFGDVFRVVEKGEAQSGVVPVENSLEGSISQVYDLLLDSNLRVGGEIELRVSHCLIASEGTRLDLIKRVFSHPQALGQCQSFLKHLGAELIPTYDTAGSVKYIKERGVTDGAAVASARAAEIYSMKILAREIEDNPNNFTRFFILSPEDSPPTGRDKTSMVFAVKHRPGALHEALKEFSTRSINLVKIESRPTRRKPWEYNFYLDFEGHRQDESFQEALAGLEQASLFVKVLGSYPRAQVTA